MYDNSSFIGTHFSHDLIFLFLCVFETVLFLLCVVRWSFLFFVAPSLAVFRQASKFNQDVSKWNTGAVTTMKQSKCTLSLSLSVASCCARPSHKLCNAHNYKKLIINIYITSMYDYLRTLIFVSNTPSSGNSQTASSVSTF